MSNEHFIIITLKNLNSLKYMALKTDNANENFPNENEISINMGKSIDINFLDVDVVEIISKTVDIRIDIDISFLESSIRKFRDEINANSNK